MTALTNSSYVRQMPNDVPQKMAQSFLATTALHIWVLSAAPPVAATWGALAAIVTLVDAVVQPILGATFPNNPTLMFITRLVAIPHSVCYFAGKLIPQLAQKSQLVCIALFAWIALNDETSARRNSALAWVI